MNEQRSDIKKKCDFYLIILLLICILAFLVQAHFVSKIKYIGTSDPALYANVADNLIKGKGFVMDIINEYIIKFSEVTHPEEWGFPGVSLILIPFIFLFGKTAFAVKLPSMIAGVILLPILTYYLGKNFFNKRIGFLAAVSMIFYPTIFPISFGGERDTLYAFFLVAGIYFFYKGIKSEKQSMAPKNLLGIVEFLKENKYFLLMGVFLGYSYLIRQVTLFIIPLLIIIYYLINKNLSKKFTSGLGICALVMFPWLVRNYLAFGDPFFTVNKYIGWIVGYAPFSNEGIFRVYWDSAKPSPSFLLQQLGLNKFALIYIQKLSNSFINQFSNFIELNLLAFIGIAVASGKTITKRIRLWMVFLLILGISIPVLTTFAIVNNLYMPLLVYLISIVAIYLGILLTSLFLFRKGNLRNTVFTLLWAAFALFFSAIWVFDIRYWLPIIPFLLIFSWFALERLISVQKILKVLSNSQQVGKILMVILVIFILFSLPSTFGKFVDGKSPFPYRDDDSAKDMLYLSEKINNITEKDATIMSCDIGVLNFYTGRKYVPFPSDRAITIAPIMQFYNVSYFTLFRCDRRAIDVNFYSYLLNNKVFTEEDFAAGTRDIVVKDYSGKIDVYKIKLPKSFMFKVYKITSIGKVGNKTNIDITGY